MAKRSALGAVILVGVFELAPSLKKHALQALGREDVADYAAPEALSQLAAVDIRATHGALHLPPGALLSPCTVCGTQVDLAYIGAIGVLNYAFPYILVPVAFNPAQFLVLPPNDPPPPPPKRLAAKA